MAKAADLRPAARIRAARSRGRRASRRGRAAVVPAARPRRPDAEDILGLARRALAAGVAYLGAAGGRHTWYPTASCAARGQRAMALLGAGRVDELHADLVAEGRAPSACSRRLLARRLPDARVRRAPRARYGGIVAFTGGLIGPPGHAARLPGLVDGTPTFLGAGDPDPHVPWTRVEESAAVLSRHGRRS
jgi:hypothetical protein